jgi:hypothetical protein
MSLPVAIVAATAMICGTTLIIVLAAFLWASTHR